MKKIITMICLIPIISSANSLDGVWKFSNASCQSGKKVSDINLKFLQINSIEFNGKSIRSYFAISPQCVLSQSGLFEVTGSTMKMGKLIADPVTGVCPAGVKLVDAPEKQVQFSLSDTQLAFVSADHPMCGQGDVVTLIYGKSKFRARF